MFVMPDKEKEFSKRLRAYLKSISIRPRNLEFYKLAVSHKSYDAFDNFERLEFLGDSFLGFCITLYLYDNFSHATEGQMSKIKSQVISKQSLYEVAKSIGISDIIRAQDKRVTRHNKSRINATIANAVESLVGAIVLDRGVRYATRFIHQHFDPLVDLVLRGEGLIDSKSLLQNHLQSTRGIRPKYQIVEVSGAEHDKTYSVIVKIAKDSYGPYRGKSIKEAEKKAALEICSQYGISEEFSQI